jgi:hypothetical protein
MEHGLLILAGMVVLGSMAGCSVSGTHHPAQVKGLVFQNLTDRTILTAKLSVIENHQFMSCSLILPGQKCSTTFPATDYEGNPVEVSWQLTPERTKRQIIVVQNQHNQHDGGLMMAIIDLGEQEASGYLQKYCRPGVCESPVELPNAGILDN